MIDASEKNESCKAQTSGLSRRTFVRYCAAGVTVAALGGGISVITKIPPLSQRQLGLPRIPEWTEANIPSLRGCSVIITGGNGYPESGRSGIGFHDALQLARAGADVIIASRKQKKGAEAVRYIKSIFPNALIRFETLDLSNLASIAGFAEKMRSTRKSLDILINNAGVMGRKNREVSANGFERVFATNTLGHFALTARLLPLLKEGNSSRVVWVSSLRAHMGTINFADLQQVRSYNYGAAYDNTKLANLLIAFEMQRRSEAEGWGISSIAAHPGVAHTNLILDGPGMDGREGRNHRFMSFFLQSPAQGALPTLYAATSPLAAPGGYYGPNGIMELGGLPGWAGIPQKSDDQQVAARLWTTLEELSGVTFGRIS
jgi:NAD(P)-dependent dehydrogenase (short-subunit alcohol dehydrogenase family)